MGLHAKFRHLVVGLEGGGALTILRQILTKMREGKNNECFRHHKSIAPYHNFNS